MEYTNLSSQVVFLKDGDIVSNYDTSCTISGNAILSNGIPSFDLFKQKNEDAILSASKLCAEIKLSVDQLLTGDNMYSGLNEYNNAISAARLSVDDEVAKNIAVENADLSNATITNLDVDNAHILTVVVDNFELSTGTISSLTATNATIDQTIANAISANTISATSLTATQSEFTSQKTTDLTATNIENTRLSVSDFAQVSKLSATGISVAYDDTGDNKGYSHVKVDDDGVAIDLSNGNYERQVKISADNDINDILINGKSLSGYIHDEAELCATSCKEYTNACITDITSNIEVSKDAVGKIITDIAQVSGKISLSVTDILESSVSNLTTDLNNLSNNYVKRSGDDIEYLSVKTDLSTKNLYVDNGTTDSGVYTKANLSVDNSGIYVDLSGDTKYLNISCTQANALDVIRINDRALTTHVHDKISTEFQEFNYSQNDHTLSIKIADKVLAVDTAEFIKNRVIKHVNVVEKGVTTKYLVLWFTLDRIVDAKTYRWEDYKWNPYDAELEGIVVEGVDFAAINISELTQVYNFRNGISSDGFLNVDVDSTIPRYSDISSVDKFNDDIRRGYGISSLYINENGKLVYGIYKLISSDISYIDNYVTNEIMLSVNDLLQNDKTYDGVNTYTNLIKTNALSATGISVVYNDPGKDTGYSHVTVDSDGVEISLSSTTQNRKVKISVDNNIDSIIVNDKSLSGYIHDEAKLCSDSCIKYTDNRINALDYNNIFDEDKKRGYVISALTQVDGQVTYGITRLISSDVDKLSDYVTNEILLSANELTDLLSAISSDLSNSISSKIWIKDPSFPLTEFYNGTYSNLSVVKIDINEYKELVKNDPNKMLCSNVLYVISSNYVETYGQQIKNVANPTDLSDATNKKYVDDEVYQTSSYLSSQISSNDNDISYLSNIISNDISAKLYDLVDNHYNNTFVSADKDEYDVVNDNLVLTNVEDTKKPRYYMTFLSGTVVLKTLDK